MRNRHIILAILCGVMMSACRSSYNVSGVERTRILIDQRYDDAVSKEIMTFMEPYTAAVDSLRKPVVGRTARYLSAYRPESPLSNLLPDMLMWVAKEYNEKPDFAVYNIGGMRAAFAEGTITYGDVMEVAPFENKICFVTLSGDKVLELFGQISKRGGEGISHEVQLTIDGKNKSLARVCVKGNEVDPKAEYRVVTIDYVAEGNDDMTAFKAATNKVMPTGVENNVREVIVRYFKAKMAAGEAVDAQTENRVTILN